MLGRESLILRNVSWMPGNESLMLASESLILIHTWKWIFDATGKFQEASRSSGQLQSGSQREAPQDLQGPP